MTPNCNLEWSTSAEFGTLFRLKKYEKYDCSNRKQSFHFMGPRLYNALPVYLRKMDPMENFHEWKAKYDIFLDMIPDNPLTGPNETGLCEHLTSKQTNSLIYWIPYMGKLCRRGDIDITNLLL